MASFEVAAEIVPGCAVSADAGGNWGHIDFGTLDGIGTATAEAALVSSGGAGIAISCTPGIDVALVADTGNHALSEQRHLRRSGGEETIGYELFVTDQRIAWSTEPVTLRFDLGTSSLLIPVHAKATLPGPMAAGTYSDTVRVTISW
ncbi:MAG: spore coat U domain-containing protein [Erythrobacter sp.]|nr:spore coat U domain-containing protein [Erythrobacter sp.]